jgi:hypothetical protein
MKGYSELVVPGPHGRKVGKLLRKNMWKPHFRGQEGRKVASNKQAPGCGGARELRRGGRRAPFSFLLGTRTGARFWAWNCHWGFRKLSPGPRNSKLPRPASAAFASGSPLENSRSHNFQPPYRPDRQQFGCRGHFIVFKFK